MLRGMPPPLGSTAGPSNINRCRQMSNRCESCNTFVALTEAEGTDDLEVNHTEGEEQFTITGRLTRNCEQCGGEMREWEVDESFDIEAPEGVDAETLEYDSHSAEALSEGGGRYAKAFYGATVTVTWKDQEGEFHEQTVEVKQAASDWDSLN